MRLASLGLSLSLFLSVSAAGAATYHVSAIGADTNDGLSPAAPWKTITKVNAAALQPGDTVLFRRGDTFAGAIVVPASGAPGASIVFGAYGSGPKPIISGTTAVTGFTPVGGNVWEAPVPTAGATVRGLFVNGVLQPIGRYPKATAPSGGYLTFTGHTGNTAITDAALAGAPNFAGGEIVIRMVHWLDYRAPITGHTGNTLSFPAFNLSSTYPLVDGSGYFVQNHRATLTQPGEWYYDAAAKKIGIYAASAPAGVSVSVVDNLFSMFNRLGITVQDLAFEGSNGDAISGAGLSTIIIESCDVRHAGTYGMHFAQVTGMFITGNTITDSLSDGIFVQSSTGTDVHIDDNTITNTGTVIGMSQGGRTSNEAISLTVKSGATISGNVITGTGYNAIHFSGDDVTVSNNVIDGFCSVLDDGGGIYTWNGPAAPAVNRKITGNIITNGVGAPAGTVSGDPQANGIYLDNNTNHVEVTGNTVYRVANKGLHMNSPASVTLKQNTFFDTAQSLGIMRWVADGTSGQNGGQDISGLSISDNIFFNKTEAQLAFSYIDRAVSFPGASTIQARLLAMGSVAGNYYYAPNPLPFSVAYRNDKSSPYVFPPDLSLSQWQGFSGLEAGSTAIPPFPSYRIDALVGPELYPAGTFEGGITSVGSYTSPLNHQLAWDTTGKLTGAESLQVSFLAPPAAPRDYVLLYGAIGPVSSSKTYVVRFSTLGTTEGGQVRVSLRKTNSPFNALSASQKRPFGTTRVDHEVVITAPTTDTVGASWQIDVLQSSGTTYIDDISVHEATVTPLDIDDSVRFEVNPTSSPVAAVLDRTYVEPRGQVHCGSVTVLPHSSRVLLASDLPCGGGGAGGAGGGFVSSSSGSTGASSGSIASSSGSIGAGGAANGGAGGAASGGAAGDGGSAGKGTTPAGCSCHVGGEDEGASQTALVAAILALVSARRRQRRGARRSPCL